jgi:hypothetical protein
MWSGPRRLPVPGLALAEGVADINTLERSLLATDDAGDAADLAAVA